MTSQSRRRALTVFGVLGALVAIVVALWALQRRLIYFPDRAAPSVAVLGPAWSAVTYDTSDGLTLAGWYRPPDPGRPLVLVFNGNAGNRADRVSLGSSMAAAGMGVLLTDYRGYGGNPGHPTEDGLAADARAAAAFAERAATGPVVYFGESLGAAVAIELASERLPAALVLRSPFVSLAHVGRVHYPWLPIGVLLKDRFPSAERLASINVPTLVIAGDRDSIVPLDQSRRIFDAAPGPKEWAVIEGADHNDVALVAGPDVIETVVSFVNDAAVGN